MAVNDVEYISEVTKMLASRNNREIIRHYHQKVERAIRTAIANNI